MTNVVILDLAHCGTSLLSGVVHRLGIPMVQTNYNTSPGRMEDGDVLKALSSEETFAALCAERRGMDWGFKHPGAWRFEWMPRYLRAPIYLAIYKDPVTTTFRKFQEIDGVSMLSTIERMRRSVMGIERRQLPCFYLSYYEAVCKPVVFTKRLAHILGVTVDEGQIAHAAAWIQPGGYNDG